MGLSRALGAGLRVSRWGLRPVRAESTRAAAGRSRLYEHARDGWTARPRLDVKALSARLGEAERELETRKGPLGPRDLRDVVRGGGGLTRGEGAVKPSPGLSLSF